jgi:hypothetical protein
MTLQGFSSPLHPRRCGEADIGPLVVLTMAFGMATETQNPSTCERATRMEGFASLQLAI